jgi:hypothetical protein
VQSCSPPLDESIGVLTDDLAAPAPEDIETGFGPAPSERIEETVDQSIFGVWVIPRRQKKRPAAHRSRQRHSQEAHRPPSTPIQARFGKKPSVRDLGLPDHVPRVWVLKPYMVDFTIFGVVGTPSPELRALRGNQKESVFPSGPGPPTDALSG